jgi:hypothetical protein
VRVTIDDTYVYWTEDAGRYIGDPEDPADPTNPVCLTTADIRWVRSVPRGGGVARTLAEISSLNVAVDSKFIYFMRGDSLLRMDKRSLAEKVVASGLAADRNAVLHRAGVWIYVGGHDGCLYTVHGQTGLVRTVCPGPESTGGSITRMASDNRYIYWIYEAGPTGRPSGIYRMLLGGDAPVDLRHEGAAWALAVDEDFLYWGDSTTVYRQCK